MLQRVRTEPIGKAGRTVSAPWQGAGLLVLVVSSIASNLLILTGPIFMLQIYDRVLPSRSLPSLLALSVVALALYGFYALIEVIRARIAVRLARSVEAKLRPRIVRAMLEGSSPGKDDLFASADIVRTFTSGPGPMTLLDLPWLPVFLGLIFLMHPLLGQVTLAGVVATIVLLLVHEVRVRPLARSVAAGVRSRAAMMHDIRGASDAIRAMALQLPLSARLGRVVSDLDRLATKVADRAGFYASLTRASRLALQSTVLAAGAYLVIVGQSTAGIIISASILSSRAVAPVEQAVNHWQSFLAAREAFGRLKPLLDQPADRAPMVSLPPPSRRLDVTDLSVPAPGNQRRLINGIGFALEAGDALGIIGSSGSGKSTLARALVGALRPETGEIRLDGNLLEHYDAAVLGDALGYLPQDVSLLSGTVAENIARFQPGSSDAVQRAAKAADIDHLIARLPEGYETPIGERGVVLSAGQRQRVGLARALHGDPFFVVLDEPNSNLDAAGEAALATAILAARARGAIVIIIAHRTSTISAVNKLMLLQDGVQALFGARDDVLRKISGNAGAGSPQGGTHATV